MSGISPTFTQPRNAYQYNGKEHYTALNLNWNDYGARWYDPQVARWWSVDPLAEKYAPMSPYNYVANNPISNIDPDGKKIVAAKKRHQKKIKNWINELSVGEFDFNESGELFMVEGSSNSNGSQYYTDRILDGIGAKKTITIYKAKRAKHSKFSKRKKFNVDKEEGGGVTVGRKNGPQMVTVTGNEYKDAIDVDGNPLKTETQQILMHELVGHAIPAVAGSDTGNAIDNENKVRAQLPEPDNKLRAPDPKHVE